VKTVKVQVAPAEGGPGPDRRLLPERLTPSTGWIRVIAIDWVTGRSGRNGSKSSCVVFKAAALGSMYSQATVSLYGELCSPWTNESEKLNIGNTGRCTERTGQCMERWSAQTAPLCWPPCRI